MPSVATWYAAPPHVVVEQALTDHSEFWHEMEKSAAPVAPRDWCTFEIRLEDGSSHIYLTDATDSLDDKAAEEEQADYETTVLFLRPDGDMELKDPVWCRDTDFGMLSPGIFGCREAWSKMRADLKQPLIDRAIRDFESMNSIAWDTWYPGYLTRQRYR